MNVVQTHVVLMENPVQIWLMVIHVSVNLVIRARTAKQVSDYYIATNTVIILNIGTDKSEQTVQTQIRLLLMEQSDQGLLCLLFCLHLLNTILHCKIQLFQL